MCHAFFIIIFSHPTSGKRLSVRYLRDVGDKGERTNAFLERKYNDDLEKQKAGKDEWKDALGRMMLSTGASVHGERSIPPE